MRGVIVTLLLMLNLALWGLPILAFSAIKFVLRREPRRRMILFLAWLAENWAGGNNRIFEALLPTRWDIEGFEPGRIDGHYLLISNHVSWVDIFALLRALHGHMPFMRFFLKQELIWFPIVGQACWGLEFPFMKRYTPEYLEQHPEKRGTDLATTRWAMKRYKRVPVTIVNYVEGTRFTPEKHAEQQSPYRHLLRPRTGGISFVLASLGDQLDAMFDITLAYPNGDIEVWDFLNGKVPWIKIRLRRLDVPPEFYTSAVTEPGPERDRLKAWMDEIWREKDALLDQLQ